MKNRTSDLRIPRSDALPLSHIDSTVSEVYYEVHMMIHVLHTAGISNVDSVMFVDRNKRDGKSEGLRFNSSWDSYFFSLYYARDKTKKHLSLFLYRAQDLPSLLFLSTSKICLCFPFQLSLFCFMAHQFGR